MKLFLLFISLTVKLLYNRYTYIKERQKERKKKKQNNNNEWNSYLPFTWLAALNDAIVGRNVSSSINLSLPLPHSIDEQHSSSSTGISWQFGCSVIMVPRLNVLPIQRGEQIHSPRLHVQRSSQPRSIFSPFYNGNESKITTITITMIIIIMSKKSPALGTFFKIFFFAIIAAMVFGSFLKKRKQEQKKKRQHFYFIFNTNKTALSCCAVRINI